MVAHGIARLTGKTDSRAAWLSLVSTQDVVGLKVYSPPGPNSGTRPAVAGAIINGLIEAGLPRSNIVIWDRNLAELRLAGFAEVAEFYGVRLIGSANEGYDEREFYDSELLGNLMWGDLEFGRKGSGVGRKSFVSKLLTRELTKIINITPLLNHNLAGVSGNLYGLASGSVDNFFRFERDAQRLARAVPEIYALPAVGDKVALSVVDALISQYEGGERGLLHYSTTLNQLRFSLDPVALDTLSLKDLQEQRERAGAPKIKPHTDLYANAALLELGINDVKRIQIDRLKEAP